MGSPVSAVIANLYMERFENLDDLLQHLNNQQPSIRLTMETEKDKKLAFLDTAVLREPDGRLTISVYRKPTYTN